MECTGGRSLGLGCKEAPRHSYDRNSSLARDASTFRVVDEKKPERPLLGDGDRFCLAWIQNPRQSTTTFGSVGDCTAMSGPVSATIIVTVPR